MRIWEQRGVVVGVCGGQRTEEGGREVVCVGLGITRARTEEEGQERTKSIVFMGCQRG